MQSLVVAFIVAPTAESSLRGLPPGTPAWVASTPEMQVTLAAARRAGLVITELHPNGKSPTQWLFNHLDSVDQHHNELSQNPPYTTLLVFGLPLSPSLSPLLQAFGFVSSSPETYGFSASKVLHKSSPPRSARR
jgi:hypothetical protein